MDPIGTPAYDWWLEDRAVIISPVYEIDDFGSLCCSTAAAVKWRRRADCFQPIAVADHYEDADVVSEKDRREYPSCCARNFRCKSVMRVAKVDPATSGPAGALFGNSVGRWPRRRLSLRSPAFGEGQL